MIRFVSYNVRYFGHPLKGLGSTSTAKNKIAQGLMSLAPAADVVCLQEVEVRSLRSRVAHRPAHDGETQLEGFMQALSKAAKVAGRRPTYEAWYFPAHVYRLGALKLYTTGLAILVNTETLSVVRGNHAEPHGVTEFGSIRAVKQKRIVGHLELEDLRGKRWHAFNTHLSLPTPFRAGFWRGGGRMGFGPNQLLETKALWDYVAITAGTQPFVLAGDFNSAPGSPVYRWLTKDVGLTCAQERLGQVNPDEPKRFATAGFVSWRMHLDHVFGRGVKFVDLDGTHAFGDPKSPFDGWSDHAPLITRFEVE